jgi:hypothetical protein
MVEKAELQSETPTDNPNDEAIEQQQQVEAEQEQPAEKPETVPLNVFLDQKKEAKELKRELEEFKQAQEREKQLRATATKGAELVNEPLKPPVQFDYDSDEAYQLALDEYTTKKIEQGASQAIGAYQERQAQEQQQLAQQQAYEAKEKAHFERVKELNAANYEEKAELVDSILGADVVRDMIANFDDSEKLIFALGSDATQAQAIKNQIDSGDVIGVVRKLERLSMSLESKPTNTDLPEPDEVNQGGGGGINSIQAQLEKLLQDKLKGKYTQNEYMEKKRALLAKAG